MFDHLSIPVFKILPSLKFYDAVLNPLGIYCIGKSETWMGYGERANLQFPSRVYLSLLKSSDSLSHSCHIAFKAASRDLVTHCYLAGLKAGGRDNGAPNLRPQYHESYFAAFMFDPSGNRVEVVCHI
jgi:hypothetical protein